MLEHRCRDGRARRAISPSPPIKLWRSLCPPQRKKMAKSFSKRFHGTYLHCLRCALLLPTSLAIVLAGVKLGFGAVFVQMTCNTKFWKAGVEPQNHKYLYRHVRSTMLPQSSMVQTLILYYYIFCKVNV